MNGQEESGQVKLESEFEAREAKNNLRRRKLCRDRSTKARESTRLLKSVCEKRKRKIQKKK